MVNKFITENYGNRAHEAKFFADDILISEPTARHINPRIELTLVLESVVDLGNALYPGPWDHFTGLPTTFTLSSGFNTDTIPMEKLEYICRLRAPRRT